MAYETVFNPRHLGMTGKGLLPVRRKGKREKKKKLKRKKMSSYPLSDWMAGPNTLEWQIKGTASTWGPEGCASVVPTTPAPSPTTAPPHHQESPSPLPRPSLVVLHILAENSRNCWKPWAPALPPSLCCLFLIITGPSQVVTICLNSLDAPPPQTVSSSQHKEPWEGSEFLISVAGIPLCPAPPDHCHLGAGPQRADS